MEKINFIVMLIVILVIIFMFKKNENFDSTDSTNQKTGLYNYFFQTFMNPYPLPLNKFYSNDIQGNPN